MLALNTPNSQIDRDMKMELNINHADHTASLRIKTPMKRLEANGKNKFGFNFKKCNFCSF